MKKISIFNKDALSLDEYLESIKKDKSIEAVITEQSGVNDQMCLLLEAALWLEQYKTVSDPRPGFVKSSWNRVLKKITTHDENAPDASASIKGGMQIKFAFRSAVAVFLALVLLFNTSVIASAARASSPGNVFYKVKKVEENVQLALSQSAEENADLHIILAKRRAAEIEELLLEGRGEYLEKAVAEFEYHLNKAWTAIDYWRVEDYLGANQKTEELQRYLTNQVLVWKTLSIMVSPSDRIALSIAISTIGP
jgi:hypothetical protein